MGCAQSLNAVVPSSSSSSSAKTDPNLDTVKPLRVEITKLPASVEQQQPRQHQQQLERKQQGQQPSPNRRAKMNARLRLPPGLGGDGDEDDGDDDDDDDGENGDDLESQMEKTLKEHVRQRDSGLSLAETERRKERRKRGRFSERLR